MAEFLRMFLDGPETTRAMEMGTPLRFKAATAGVKRDGLDIAALPWRFDNYRANPVFLWAHDYRLPPLGRVVIREGQGSEFGVDVVFDQDDELAVRVERKYRAGFLSAVSIGWDDVDANGVPVYRSRATAVAHDLLDVSAVPVPGDPGALVERQARALAALRGDIDALLGDAATSGVNQVQWERAAAEMAELFVPELCQVDAKERERRYHRLCAVYRKADRTPPELLELDRLALLSPTEIRGLFFENEPRLVPELLIPAQLEPAQIRAIVREELAAVTREQMESDAVQRLHKLFMEVTP
jgi:hypothetical protein